MDGFLVSFDPSAVEPWPLARAAALPAPALRSAALGDIRAWHTPEPPAATSCCAAMATAWGRAPPLL
jgi:hypothetical protein